MKITVSDDPRITPLVRELMNKAKANNGTLTIATHNGKFHADECLCIAMLKHKLKLLWTGRDDLVINVVRTRNAEKINAADIAVDVGDGPYDHHSTITRYANGVPYASCGKLLEAIETNKAIINLLLDKSLYAVQLADNGESSVRYPINYFSWIGLFNETYKEAIDSDFENAMFDDALGMVESMYERLYLVIIELIENRKYLQNAKFHVGGKIIELPTSRGISSNFVFKKFKNVCGILNPHESDGCWTLKWISNPNGVTFENTISFPLEWRSEIGATNGNTQIASKRYTLGCTFCHPSGHMASFDTRDHAISAAIYVMSLDYSAWN
jgi:uncharacterized UPF0160 family protein